MRRMILLSTVLLMTLVPGTVVAQGQSPYLNVTYAATTDTFYPSDDSEISQFEPDANYGSLEYMLTRNSGGSNWEADVLVKFDISSIGSGETITSAKLKLYYFYWDDNNPAGNFLDLCRITSDWNEDSVTWTDKPTHTEESCVRATVPGSPGVWMEWDVTADVQSFVSEPATNYGWLLIDMTYFGGVDIPRTWFRTKEMRTPIPTLSQSGLLGFGSLLLGAMFVAIHRQHSRGR